MKRKSSFTLLEICVAVAILAVAAVAVGWQMKNLISAHHFHQSVSHLLTDLKKCQVLALSDRTDIEVRIQKKGEEYTYYLHTDEPNLQFSKRPKPMKGIRTITAGKKTITSLTIPIYPSGRIEQKEVLRLLCDEENGIELDFSKPLFITKKTIPT